MSIYRKLAEHSAELATVLTKITPQGKDSEFTQWATRRLFEHFLKMIEGGIHPRLVLEQLTDVAINLSLEPAVMGVDPAQPGSDRSEKVILERPHVGPGGVAGGTTT